MKTYYIVLKDECSDLIYGVVHFKELVDSIEVESTIRACQDEDPEYEPIHLIGAIEVKFPVKSVIWYDCNDFEVLEV